MSELIQAYPWFPLYLFFIGVCFVVYVIFMTLAILSDRETDKIIKQRMGK